MLAPAILAETAHFIVLSVPSPAAPSHLLIVPRAHVASLSRLPRALWPELRALRRRVHAFLAAEEGPALFLERHVPRRPAAHAQLHALPAATASWLPTILADAVPLRGGAALQAWQRRHGGYLYLALSDQAYVARPSALPAGWAGCEHRDGWAAAWDSSMQGAVRARWQTFQRVHGQPTTRVVNCVLVNDGAVCLLKRSAAVGSGRGKWHIVSGYLPEGKDPLAHAYDEVAEETGLRRDQLTLRRHSGPLLFADRAGGRPWEVDTYLFVTATRELRLNWEHDLYEWVAPERLGEYDCLPWLLALYRAVADGA